MIPATFVGLLFGSMILGVFLGIIASLILKHIGADSSGNSNKQLGVMMVTPWAVYLLSEFAGLSGIVSIMFCGFVMAKYSMPNLSERAKESTISIYEGVSFNIEIIIFVYMGLSFTGFKNHFK